MTFLLNHEVYFNQESLPILTKISVTKAWSDPTVNTQIEKVLNP